MSATLFYGMLVGPAVQLVSVASSLAEAMTGIERCDELLREPVESAGTNRHAETHRMVLQGRVDFRSVTFFYHPGRVALDDISFSAEPGTLTALVGRSGAGKSTILSLIAGFYSPSSGVILVDGNPLESLDLYAYRRQLGIVFQEAFLVDGTIRDNILFARTDKGDAAFRQACRMAHVDEFALRLSDGYDTRVGERGVSLSAGQRQRISIARAFLADPRILLLDEATSNLDSESEAAIQDAVDALIKDRTTFVCAHRFSTVMSASRILVLDNGRVREVGDHGSLSSAPTLYRDLWRIQNVGAVRA